MFCCCLLAGSVQADAVSVRVGGYLFPPYVDVAANGEAFGLAPDLLAALNRSQSEFRFQFVLTSPNRRFQDFAAGRFDMMLFEDQRWGWANTVMEPTTPFLRDGDVFVSQSHRDPSYFAELAGKRIFAVRGYHYAFAGYNADPEQLKQQFDIDLLDPRGPSLDRGLQAVANGQAELMMVTESYLNYYFQQRPDLRDRLLIASERDSEYRHGALVRRLSGFHAGRFDELLELLRSNGELSQLTNRYGISHLLLTPPAP
ncbi:MAG TPA: transporter substrate-binding domain-containing protein [Permianibacter sp.]|nr:transporter substrate-binding domain-containing protein [Permianibacter sp.]